MRIAGIDAPERTQPFADVSRKALRNAIDRRDVRIETIKIDVFGRLVGHVFVDGDDVGLSQLEAGLAWHFARYDADLRPAQRVRYAQAQALAKTRRAGLWRQSDPLAPWLFRKQQRQRHRSRRADPDVGDVVDRRFTRIDDDEARAGTPRQLRQLRRRVHKRGSAHDEHRIAR